MGEELDTDTIRIWKIKINGEHFLLLHIHIICKWHEINTKKKQNWNFSLKGEKKFCHSWVTYEKQLLFLKC